MQGEEYTMGIDAADGDVRTTAMLFDQIGSLGGATLLGFDPKPFICIYINIYKYIHI